MKRKLVKQAGQALTITLPIEWVRANGLNAGDEIDVEQNEKTLVLNSNKKTITGKLKLDITKLGEKLRFLNINAAYARGIDEIELEATSYPELTQTMGYAVVSQKLNRYVIRDIAGNTGENLDDIFKRVFQMVLSFYDEAINNIFYKDSNAKYENIQKIDGEINKFVLFLERAIMKLSHTEPANTRILFTYSFALEKLGDEVLRLWRASLKGKIKKDKEIKEIIEFSKKTLEKAFEIYYFPTDERIQEAVLLKDRLRERSIKFMNINSATTEVLMHSVRIAEDSIDLIHLSLMRKFKPA